VIGIRVLRLLLQDCPIQLFCLRQTPGAMVFHGLLQGCLNCDRCCGRVIGRGRHAGRVDGLAD